MLAGPSASVLFEVSPGVLEEDSYQIREEAGKKGLAVVFS